ncbi:LysR family transcriptional regulator [Aestuariivirga sp.]|uniref:LysR family transcriptional regulator n=1 Tax=Aestuariivirga sp. TaxID=2650926 RepID=UPI0039E49CEC
MIPFTIRQIEYALAVHEHGSVAAASVALGIAQPTVSAAVAKLEDLIGLQLFIRHHAQGVTAAPQGLKFLAEARNLLTHAQELRRDLAQAGPEIEGTLTIGSFSTIAPVFAPRLIGGFLAQHPKVKVRLEEGTQETLYEGLRSGRYDVTLLYDVDTPADLALTPLDTYQPYVLLPAAHPLTAKKRISLHEVADEPFILLDIAPSRTYFTRLLENADIVPKVAFASPSLEVVRGLVGQGLGYSILITRPHGDHSYAGDALAVRPIADPVAEGIIALAILKSLRKTRLVAAFEQYCRDHFPDFGSAG